jgi:hypothetical protein
MTALIYKKMELKLKAKVKAKEQEKLQAFKLTSS